MTRQSLMRAALIASAGAILVGAGYVVGVRHAMNGAAASAVPAAAPSGAPAPQAARKVLYWHDPMVPNQHFDKPGKSPFMDMQLQPVYADEGGDAPGVRIDPGLQQNLGIRYATVRRQQTAAGFDAVGATQFDEARAAVVQSRVTGYIDHLYARAPMQRIAKGAPVASLFVPDWLAPQEEYLALKRGGMDGSLLDAARARMRALSIPDGMIAALDRTGRAQTHVVLSAPEAGVVSELNVRDGAMVAPGQTLAKIAGLSTLWLIVEVPEALALNVRPGMSVDATFAGNPARHFSGRIREVLPGISTGSRTLQARVEIDNASLKLTPGMLMRVRVAEKETVSRLLVPSEAVIATGQRTIVIVKHGDGRLQPASVTVGSDVGGDTEVLAGLNEGDTVVASGQFLIDSEASLKSVLPRLERAAGASAAASSVPATAPVYETTGKVEKVTADDITFSHQPVPALGWGAMTMAFGKPSAHAFSDVKPGQTVRFAFTQTDDGYRLTKVEPQRGER
ncbi:MULTISPECIES: efflux RND transporter periplasmic adaptor subunit [Burkholderia]|uniref:efflux RND transporter periplasmic adaptor subunit n=1 Tax=Burkholderia TaxID=32008 RepID=UPI0007553B25|nr:MULTISPECIES: efflux RND transporter periplasmic adaptor subunit [Burkholderia]KVN51521.1 RND transporter MFP subunit [Burkholderia anthina]MCA8106893.1 efflux RND transporter periplasmic adaptor subunit [Burkholderia sp. AU36459]MDF3099025.1 efflux RND transporter periplasmic adaptor subunit [Burkholderia semiarida]MDF3117530.1 efflux RND transporter periplasmic adaptor subunit [Burkholderia semiarida]OXI21021.1 efflux RND transporter periplasmic adaptor subunit [Burkholderia sp. AU16482]